MSKKLRYSNTHFAVRLFVLLSILTGSVANYAQDKPIESNPSDKNNLTNILNADRSIKFEPPHERNLKSTEFRFYAALPLGASGAGHETNHIFETWANNQGSFDRGFGFGINHTRVKYVDRHLWFGLSSEITLIRFGILELNPMFSAIQSGQQPSISGALTSCSLGFGPMIKLRSANSNVDWSNRLIFLLGLNRLHYEASNSGRSLVIANLNLTQLYLLKHTAIRPWFAYETSLNIDGLVLGGRFSFAPLSGLNLIIENTVTENNFFNTGEIYFNETIERRINRIPRSSIDLFIGFRIGG